MARESSGRSWVAEVGAGVVLGLGLLYAAGPLAAVNGLLDAPLHTNLFSPSKFVLANTVFIIVDGLRFIGLGLVAWAIAGGAWRFWGERCRVAGGIVAVAALGVWAARLVGLHVPMKLGMAVMGVVWGVSLAFYDRQVFRLGLVPAICLYRAIVLIGVPEEAVVPLFFASAGGLEALLALWLRSSGLRTFAVEAAGAGLLAGVAVALAAYKLHGDYIWSFDLGYTLGFLGLAVGLLMVGLAVAPATMGSVGAVGVVAVLALVLTGAGYFVSGRHVPVKLGTVGERPNIVWFVWDTARADALEPYGAPRGDTPVAAALAKQGVVFERAVTAAPWTLPSHASMFTGLWPRMHAACNGGYWCLHKDFRTIAEVLRDAGYQTVAFSGNYFNVTPRTGLDQGFETFYAPGLSALWHAAPIGRYREGRAPYMKGGEAIVEAVKRWIVGHRDPKRPVFVFVNLLEPHHPYGAPRELTRLPAGVTLEEARRIIEPRTAVCDWAFTGPVGHGISSPEKGWEVVRAMYRSGIRYTDWITGEILRGLGCVPEDVGDGLMLILTSDHGEMLGEHDRSDHQFALFEPLVHVPLMMVWEGKLGAGKRIRQRVCTIALYRTVAEAAGVRDVGEPVDTASLVDIAEGGGGEREPAIVIEYWPHPGMLEMASQKRYRGFAAALGRLISPLQATFMGRWKYIRALGQAPEALYDIETDPDETRNVAEEHPEVCRRARQMLDEWIRETPSGLPTFLDGMKVPSPAERLKKQLGNRQAE